jgi:hypothetical protein
MALESTAGMMDQDMKESGMRTRSEDSEHTHGSMVGSTRENG